ncbi:MAG: hypothetical protein IV100_22010 [Myxococcales bacterium]|nr:hypothetical protein [Myxococcales bacterium]
MFKRDDSNPEKKVCALCPRTDKAPQPEARTAHINNLDHLKHVMVDGKPKYYCKGDCKKQIPRGKPVPRCLESVVDKTCDRRTRRLVPAAGHMWCGVCGGAVRMPMAAPQHPKKKARKQSKQNVAHSSTSLSRSHVSTATGGTKRKASGEDL